jgi:iron complex outermembrane recepter protein
MNRTRSGSIRARLALGAAIYALCTGWAFAQSAALSLPEQPLGQSLKEIARQTGTNILFTPETVAGRRAHVLNGTMDAQEAVKSLVQGTDLESVSDGSGGIIVRHKGEDGHAQASGAVVIQPSAPAPTMEADNSGIETVTVTATKRAESVENIPASITALTGAELEQRGSQDIADIVKLVPGVNLTAPAGNAERITIRGIAGEANTNPTTGILFGDLSFNDDYVPHVTFDPNPFDMQDVEVLKGPQGTLFGASALNGAIRYVPNAPDLDTYSAKYYVQYGAVQRGDNPWGMGGMVNIPLDTDTLALRIVAYDSATPGWIDNKLAGVKDANRGHEEGGRAELAWHPVERLHVNLTYAMQQERMDDVPDADNRNGALSNDDHFRESPEHDRYDLLSLNADYHFDAFDLVSETGYIRKDYKAFEENTFSIIPGGDLPLVDNTGDARSKSYSQEFRLVSNDGPDSQWSWLAGVFASKQDIQQIGAYQLGDPSLPPSLTASLLDLALGPGAGDVWLATGQPDYNDSDIDVSVKELAAFANVTRKFADGWELSVGGRLYSTSSGGVVDNSGLLMMLTGFPGGRTINDTVKNTGFDPKVSLTWHMTDDAMVYAAASKGYRVGGIQWGNSGFFGTQPAPDLFKTDTIWNYELGLRSKWLDNTLQFDLTGFYEQWKDPQVLIFVSNGLGAYIDNLAGVDSKGVEASAEYLVPQLPGLSVRASATYDEAITTAAFSDGTVFVPKGAAWPLSPKWQTAVSLDYEKSFDDWYVGGNLTDTYLGKAIYGVDQPDVVFGYNSVDAQLRIGRLDLPSAPEFAVTLTNAFDKRGITTSYSGTFWHEVTYVQPRTIMVRISGSF